jgi:hypothetical protein
VWVIVFGTPYEVRTFSCLQGTSADMNGTGLRCATSRTYVKLRTYGYHR